VHRGLFVLRPPDGAAKWLAVTASPLRGADSTPDGVVLSLTDATRARNGELALKETMERFRLLAENSSDIIALHNADLSLRYVSPACRTILGYEPSELVDHNLLEMVAPEDMAVLVDLPDEETATFELRARTKDGRMVWLEVKLRRIVDWATGQVTEIQTASRDISERKRLEARLTELAMHDGLTGLANRVLLIDRLEHALARRGSGTHRVAVLFVDLDRFKLVNDTLGHAAGDAVLEAVGTRIRETVRPADTAARLGGDEFVVVCEDVSGEQEAVAVAERLEAALAAPHVLESGEVVVTASVGIVVTERHMPAEALLRMADVAMYEAKQDGRACHRLFR
jgi:diguanylate cyclase (GGDEF)-like protein/PAS domain S-box-containing protein